MLLVVLVTAVVAGGGAFYGGMQYQKTQAASARGAGNFQNLSAEERQARFASSTRQGGNGGAVAGEIIAKDAQSITVKMTDGGSKIVFFSTSTKIQKSAEGTGEDLKIGEQVFVNGSVNSDGSVSAESIQLRPVELLRDSTGLRPGFPTGNR